MLVRKVAPQTKIGGIVLPDSALKKSHSGHILATGPGARDKEGRILPLSVKTGDKVLLSEYGGTPIELDGEELHIYHENDILGIWKEKD